MTVYNGLVHVHSQRFRLRGKIMTTQLYRVSGPLGLVHTVQFFSDCDCDLYFAYYGLRLVVCLYLATS